jgi:hypothetical protein
MAIQFLNDLSLHGSVILTQDNEDFPENPAIGTIVLKDQVIYAYITIGGLSTWYPFSSKTNSYIHTQGVESTSWLINHGLGTTDTWYQVQDIYGRIMMPAGITPVDENSFYIDFSAAVVGTAIIVGPDTVSAPSVETSLIDVNNGTVVIDSTGIKVNGEYLSNTGGAATVDPTLINAETTARIAADSTLQSTINAEATARIAADATLQAAIDALGASGNEIVSIAASNIDCSLGSFFKKTVSTTTTFSFSNVPASVAYLATVEIVHTSGTINWPPAVTWPDSLAPTLTTGKTHIFNFLTDDGGTTWRGSSLVNYA